MLDDLGSATAFHIYQPNVSASKRHICRPAPTAISYRSELRPIVTIIKPSGLLLPS
jgi:hypothetical protein